jgi:hypothetical protein
MPILPPVLCGKSNNPNPRSIPPTTSQHLTNPPLPIADADTFNRLVNSIGVWQLIASNRISDLRSPRSGWTGNLPSHYGLSAHEKLSWSEAKAKFIDAKAKGASAATVREARDLLVRVLWFFQLELSPKLLGEKMRIRQLNQALKVREYGPESVLVRVMYWVM